MEWTNEAKEKLHAQVERLLAVNNGGGAVTDVKSDAYVDLYTDLKAHAEEVLYEKGILKIGSSDVECVLQEMGSVEDDAAMESHEYPVQVSMDRSSMNGSGKLGGKVLAIGGGVAFYLFGILVPVVAIIGEFFAGWCSDIFFSPLPTGMHFILVSLVPVTMLLTRYWLKNVGRLAAGSSAEEKKFPYVVAVLLGFTLPTISYYTVLFIPTYFVAAIGVIFLLGLLPFAALFSLVTWLKSWSNFKLSLIGSPYVKAEKWVKYGVIAGFLTLFAVELPSYIRQQAFPMLVSEDAEVQAEGAMLIRRYGGEAELLDRCYGGGRSNGLGSLAVNPAQWVQGFMKGNRGNRMTAQDAREAYYRVTGVPFNSIEPDQKLLSAGRGMDFVGEWDWDADHGGDTVAGKVRGLSLHSSRIDTHLDGASRLGYAEWILEFKNDARTDKEARMQIALPHGAVVSKLTLWVNGEEQPAAFNTVSKVKSAYKQIAVAQRRDPVLVNVSGPDMVMLQCFPVPAGGGLMKTKVGITFPLDDHAGSQEGVVYFPYISERNFSINKGLKHEVYAQAAMSLRSGSAQVQKNGKHFALTCSLPNTKLKTESITWQDEIMRSNNTVWTSDAFHEGSDKYLVRSSDGAQPKPLDKLIVVIDGSACIAKWQPALVDMLESGGDKFHVLVASDTVEVCRTAEELANVDFVGGVDNVAALREALLVARSEGNEKAAIVWLHGPQPVKFSSIAGLEQDVERSILSVPIYNVALEDGENFVLKSFKSNPQFRGGYRVVNESDLTQMMDKISTGDEGFSYRWDHQAAPPTEGKEVWDHLARQWAHQQVVDQWIMGHGSENAANAKLAAHYQLVTPVSGAVVLESLSQYKETGLEPPSSLSGPNIPVTPEPSSVLLLFVGLLGTAFHRRRE